MSRLHARACESLKCLGLAALVLASILILTSSSGSALSAAGVQSEPDASGGLAQAAASPQPSLFRQTNLVSDLPGVAQLPDPSLVNPWGITMTATSPFWVSNNGTASSTLYSGGASGSPLTKVALVVSIPGANPTGMVANTTNDFVVTSTCASPPCASGPARFLWASESGNITGWNPAVPAANSTIAQVGASVPNAVYKGLAIANTGSANFLYAANFASGQIDVFDKTFARVNLAGSFTDPTIPSGFAPFNIQSLGGRLLVAYAKQDPTKRVDVRGPGNGFLDAFDLNGNFLGRLVSNGVLNSPWGMAIAPAGFGTFANMLLVGNFGDGRINAFDPGTGAFQGALSDEGGNPISIEDLWGLAVGNGKAGGDPNTLYFAAGIGKQQHGLFGSIQLSSAATSQVQFSAPSYTADEGDGSINITVTRTGDVTGSASVNYATFDDTARQTRDYIVAAGTLNFGPGDSNKTFKVLLVDDLYADGVKTLNLMLSNPAGVSLVSPSTATLTITDNDSATPTTNPLDDPQFFVREQYLDFLNREPDTGGGAYWSGQIGACGGDPVCVRSRRIGVSAAFFIESEFQQTAFYVYRVRKATLGQRPTYAQFVVDRNQLPTASDANLTAFTEAFAQRPEFLAKYPVTQNGSDYLDAVLATVKQSSGIDLTSKRGELANEYLLGLTQAQSRARVIRKLIQYPEYIQAETNPAFVLSEYFGYLRRDPDAPGFQFWLNVLNGAPGNFRGMVCSFITSTEYQQRLSPIVTHTNSECGP